MDTNAGVARMKRQIHAVPVEMTQALEASGLLDAYNSRRPHQQNDYVGWISRTERAKIRDKRIAQMLAELEERAVYMKMKWIT